MKSTRSALIPSALILLVSLSLTSGLKGQTGKKALGLDDIELWRNNSVTLSDNGKWYTVLYSLNERPDAGSNQNAGKKDSTKNETDFYGSDAKTDVLYICNSDGIKQRIERGANPRFSSSSEWIAYSIEPESGRGGSGNGRNGSASARNSSGNGNAKTIIELRNLATGFTRRYESNAQFSFLEDMNYFVSSDRSSLLIYDLDELMEHFIGDMGEYLADKRSPYLVYTISSDDTRGNGIYLFDLKKKTTLPLLTGNFIYSNLTWNKDRTALAALKYTSENGTADYENAGIVTITGIGSSRMVKAEYPVKELTGMPENMGLATGNRTPSGGMSGYMGRGAGSGSSSGGMEWSNDGGRIFLKIMEYEPTDKQENANQTRNSEQKATVDVWHWKDEKIFSQQVTEAEQSGNATYDAVFSIKSKKIIPLTSNEDQRLIRSRGTDRWALEMDSSPYITDWDIRRYDLYRVNMVTGEKKLVEKEYPGSVNVSPDGENVVMWIDGNYWCYNFANDKRINISSGAGVSFIDKENDHFGSTPDYGFTGWAKGGKAVIVNHFVDLWLLPVDGISKAENLTASRDDPDTRFTVEDMSFTGKPEIEDRYIDLSSPLLLSAFNVKTKYAGFYRLQDKKLKQLIYEPASFSAGRRGSGLIKAKTADVVVFKKGDYKSFPEAYLAKSDFSNPKKLTTTNPQQKDYLWEHRILINYTNDDGVPLQGILSIPDNYKEGEKLPMMVYSYEKLSQNMYSYPTVSIGGSSICEMTYVSDGYLFLQPDIHFNIGTPHSDMHECIDAAIRKVIELGYVDEDHIGYEGFSFGGHCGQYIATQKNRFAAIAAGAGVSNLVQAFSIDIVGDGHIEKNYYIVGQGRLGTDFIHGLDIYLRESAVFNAETMNTPLLLFHGTADNVVQWEHSLGYYSVLRYLKKPVIFLSYEGEGHGLRQKANRIDIQTRLKQYFDYYLKGKEAPAWITDGVPYDPEKSPRNENRRMVPAWR